MLEYQPLLSNIVISELLVQASPGLGPHQLGGLLSVVQQGLGLGGTQKDGLLCEEREIMKLDPHKTSSMVYYTYLAISAHVLNAVARIDSVLAESAKFGSEESR